MKESIEFLLVVGLMGLLFLLRLDAQRFGVAEYDDSRPRPRLAGLAPATRLVRPGPRPACCWSTGCIPQPVTVLHLDMGPDRERALIYGLAAGIGGIVLAFLFAWFRYGGFRLPAPGAYPGAILNSVGTAVIDEALFRGIMLGLLLHAGVSAPLAIAIQAIAVRRRDAPVDQGSQQGDAVHRPRHRRSWAAGWSSRRSGIGAAVVAHAITRFGVFLATGHSDQARPVGWEPEEVAGRALPPKGWDLVGDETGVAAMDGRTVRSARARARRTPASHRSRHWDTAACIGAPRHAAPPPGMSSAPMSGPMPYPEPPWRPAPAPAYWDPAAQQGSGPDPTSGPWVADPVTGAWSPAHRHRMARPAGVAAHRTAMAAGTGVVAGSTSRRVAACPDSRVQPPDGRHAAARRPPRTGDHTAEPRPRPPVGLYVHIPFCVSLCPYCDFVVVTGRAAVGPANRIAELVAALHAELDLRADAADAAFGRRPPLASVYLGGGTPSLLSAEQVGGAARPRRAALRHRRRVPRSPSRRTPGPDELGDLAGFRAAGVTRLSIGAQSLQPDRAPAARPTTSAGDVAVAVRAARAAGFDSVSIDLLMDIPGQTLETWDATLDMVLDLRPDHVSIYLLTLEDPDADGLTTARRRPPAGASGCSSLAAGAASDQDEDRAADMDALTGERLAAAGTAPLRAVQPRTSRATRAGTTWRTGSASRWRPWVRVPMPSMAP